MADSSTSEGDHLVWNRTPALHPIRSASVIVMSAKLPSVGVTEASKPVPPKFEWHAGKLFPRVGSIVTKLNKHSKNVVNFCSGRGTAEQWIKEGKDAVKWTKLCCRTYKYNQTRLQLFALTYNQANFLRRLALSREIDHWSLPTLREKLVKIKAKVVRHPKYVTFQLAEVAVPRVWFAAILDRIKKDCRIRHRKSSCMTARKIDMHKDKHWLWEDGTPKTGRIASTESTSPQNAKQSYQESSSIAQKWRPQLLQ